MTGFRQHVDADAGECPVRSDQAIVDSMHTGNEASDAGQIHPRGRRTGEHARAFARRHEGAGGFGGQRYVGVKVEPGERTARIVADRDRVCLPGQRCLDHADIERTGNGRRVVGTRVRNHDDVELAGARSSEQPGQIRRDYRRLVMRRDDDACDRLPAMHVRISVHSDLRVLLLHIVTDTPQDRISATVPDDRLDSVDLLSIAQPMASLWWAAA
jgi:hypothetical protein